MGSKAAVLSIGTSTEVNMIMQGQAHLTLAHLRSFVDTLKDWPDESMIKFSSYTASGEEECAITARREENRDV